jgi:hypothetical protein
MQHSGQGNMQPPSSFFSSVHHASSDNLHPYQDVNCDSDTMVGIREASVGTNGLKAEDDNNRAQKEGQDLEPYVQPECQSGISTVESHEEDGEWDDPEECDGCDDTVRFN